MKNKVIVSAILLGIGVVASASNVQLIRTDRVWESVTQDGYYYFRYMKFDGTLEFNGKQYSRISTFREIVMDSNNNVRDYRDNIDETEGYLREEDGVVYTLIEGDSQTYAGGEIRYPLTEETLYNFHCPVGASYDGMTFLMLSPIHGSFDVKASSTVSLGGEECRQMDVVFTERDYPIEYP